MNRRALTFLIFATISAGSAVFVACSDESGGTPLPVTKKDATSGDTGDGDEDSGPVDSGKKETSNNNTECVNFPFPRDGGAGVDAAGVVGVFCPFSVDAGPFDAAAPDSGFRKTSKFCPPGDNCYLATFDGLANCQKTAGDTSAGGVNWACNNDGDCKTGVCCGFGTLAPTFKCDTQVRPKSYKGTACQAACDSSKNEFKICDKAGGCESGQTCSPFSHSGSTLGACK